MKRHDEINIFKTAKFGDHFLFDGDECLFLQQVSDYSEDGSEPLYDLVVHRHIKYKDGREKDYAMAIRSYADGFTFTEENDDGNIIEFYVTPPGD